MRIQTTPTPERDTARPHGENSNGQIFAIATSLARKKRYSDATKSLRRALEAGDCSELDALDLQARIYAQQGMYLEAEACWRQAKKLDGADGRYDDALARLRRSRVSSGRGFLVLSGVAVFSVLALLLWQVFVTTPNMSHQLAAQQAAVASLRSAIDEAMPTAEQRDADLADSVMSLEREEVARHATLTEGIASLVRDGADRDARLTESIGMLGTAKGAATNRQAVIARMAAAFEELRETMVTTSDGLASRRSEADAAAQKRVAVLRAAVASLAESLGATEAALLARVEASDASAMKRLDQAIAGLNSRMDQFPSSDSVAALDKQIIQLREQLTKITAAIEALEPQQPSEDDLTVDDNTTSQSVVNYRPRPVQILGRGL